MFRRAFAIGGGLVLVVAAALLVRGCLDARQERAFEDYVQETSSVVSESTQEGESLFELLEDPGDLTAVEVQNSVNGLSVDAERLVERAEAAEAPDELSSAHDAIVQMLDLRRGGLEQVSEELPTALGDEEREEAIDAIAFDMQTFLASDVVYSSQAVPVIEDTLVQQGLPAEIEELPEGDFFPDIEWLQADRVEKAIDEVPASEGDAGEDGAATGEGEVSGEGAATGEDQVTEDAAPIGEGEVSGEAPP
jgi:hypothetical protein